MGQTFSLSHLAPFVDVSRQKWRRKFEQKFKNLNIEISDEDINRLAEDCLADEIKAGVQTIQYQLVTLMTTNGQTPFVSMFIYLDEVPEGRTRDDLALLAEEVFKQRHEGLKNEKGVFVPAAFPKLLYVLDEDNIHPDSDYRYLTELAAWCSAKTMVPDYISAKTMKELKGDVYPCMGCVDGESVIDYKIKDIRYVESFESAWNRLGLIYEVKTQPNGKDEYINTPDVTIFDNVENKYVPQHRIIRNTQSEWYSINLSNAGLIDVTDDHPFEVIGKGVVLAKDIVAGDKIKRQTAKSNKSVHEIQIKRNEQMWLLGMMLCNSSYMKSVIVSLNTDEAKIAEHAQTILNEINYKSDIEKFSQINAHIKLNVQNSSQLCEDYIRKFKGTERNERQIPDCVFNGSYADKMSFIAGMTDANSETSIIETEDDSVTIIKFEFGNYKLATQTMLLAKEVGIDASMDSNRYYYPMQKEKIKYYVEFNCPKDLSEILISEKERNCLSENLANANKDNDTCFILDKTPYQETKYSYDVTTESEHFTVNGVYSHNCRSFLTPDRFTEKGVGNIAKAKNYDATKHKYYGRFNQGVVTINLPDVALSSGGDKDKFWEIFEERLELCHKALRRRHERLLGTPSDIAPILWQHGALARLEKGETIDKLLYDGYSTISLGYAGLYECVKYMTGVSHTDPKGKPFAIEVMQYMNDKCNEWKLTENIDYSLYGTPLESTTYKFAKTLQDRFGIIPEITDHNYITNSYHVNVRENINAFDKLDFESEFQSLSPGGYISYVEVPNLQNNIGAILALIEHIYNHIPYAEINTKSDYCQVCGYNGEIRIEEDKNKKLYWKCPNCGNTDQNKMNVVRRTCGYLGTQFWNQGRTQEIKDRVLHL